LDRLLDPLFLVAAKLREGGLVKQEIDELDLEGGVDRVETGMDELDAAPLVSNGSYLHDEVAPGRRTRRREALAKLRSACIVPAVPDDESAIAGQAGSSEGGRGGSYYQDMIKTARATSAQIELAGRIKDALQVVREEISGDRATARKVIFGDEA